MMKTDNLILDKTFDFALEIVQTYKFLVEEKREYVLSKQLVRSGTSIGANMREANLAISKKEFIAKAQIAL
jgi:four helix bundle protein